MYNPFSENFLFSLIPYLAIIFVSVIIEIRIVGIILNLKKEKNFTLRNLIFDQQGSSTMEFALLLPLLLAILMVILQIALIVQAKFIVNYAAFCAIRSAIVTIPAKISGNGDIEEPNEMDIGNADSPKMQILRRAAALPCVAISPNLSASLVLATGTGINSSVITQLPKVMVVSPPKDEGLNFLKALISRGHYAYNKENTKIEIQPNASYQEDGKFKDNDLITVKLTYKYYLAIPFANRALGTAYSGLGGFGSFFSRAWYLPITEQYSLINEGEPVFPESQEDFLETEEDRFSHLPPAKAGGL